MGVFTSDLFLKAFVLARRAEPVYGAQMWIVRRAIVKMAECSPWNGFVEHADPAIRVAGLLARPKKNMRMGSNL